MSRRILICLCLTICCSIVLAEDPPSAPPDAASAASEASLKELLEVAKARKVLDSMLEHVDKVMKQAMQEATGGKPVSAKVQKHIDKLEADLKAVFKEECSWEKMEPIYLRIYQKSLTQQEVDGMIAFYKTPAGKAVMDKMPIILQNSVEEMKQMMGPMMQRLQRMQQEVMAEMKEEEKRKNG
jgi:uncharacterized protein